MKIKTYTDWEAWRCWERHFRHVRSSTPTRRSSPATATTPPKKADLRSGRRLRRPLSSEALYGNYYSLQISNADDLCYFNNYNSTESRPDRYNHCAGTSAIYDTWLKLYQGIKNANEYIQGCRSLGDRPRSSFGGQRALPRRSEIPPGLLPLPAGAGVGRCAPCAWCRRHPPTPRTYSWPPPRRKMCSNGASMRSKRSSTTSARILDTDRLACQPGGCPGHSGPHLPLHGR